MCFFIWQKKEISSFYGMNFKVYFLSVYRVQISDKGWMISWYVFHLFTVVLPQLSDEPSSSAGLYFRIFRTFNVTRHTRCHAIALANLYSYNIALAKSFPGSYLFFYSLFRIFSHFSSFRHAFLRITSDVTGRAICSFALSRDFRSISFYFGFLWFFFYIVILGFSRTLLFLSREV